MEGLSDVSSLAEDSVTLTCRIAPGTPPAQLSWYKGETQLNLDKHYQIAYDDCVATLTIPSGSPGDSGEYRCEAKNKLGAVETSCSLTIQSEWKAAGILIQRHHIINFV